MSEIGPSYEAQPVNNIMKQMHTYTINTCNQSTDTTNNTALTVHSDFRGYSVHT